MLLVHMSDYRSITLYKKNVNVYTICGPLRLLGYTPTYRMLDTGQAKVYGQPSIIPSTPSMPLFFC